MPLQATEWLSTGAKRPSDSDGLCCARRRRDRESVDSRVVACHQADELMDVEEIRWDRRLERERLDALGVLIGLAALERSVGVQ